MSGVPDRLIAALADRYRIERELGEGGMATVYLAEDLKHDRKVALKVLKPELAAVVGAERFLAEIKTTANLQHPHILALFDSGQVEGTVFYVMPFVDGESLRDRLAREKQLPIDVALAIAREVGDALQYAHAQGVIHRDIKPENILLHGGHALVADFGIALAAAKTAGSRMTETGMSLGTPTYMSPEQAMGERTLDARTDIYALGCVTYEMLTGDAPFTGSTAQAIVAKVLTEKPAPIRTQRDRVPEHVEDAVLTALEKLPADRFATAGEFVAAIAGGGGTGSTASRTRARAAAAHGVATHWRTAAGVLGAVSLALAAVILLRPGAAESPGVVRLEVHTNEPVASLPVVIAGSPDGSSYVYCSSTGAALLRRWEDLAPAPLGGPLRGCVAAAYSPDGARLAVIGVPVSLQVYTVRGVAARRELRVEGLGDVAVNGGGIDWASDGQLYVASGTKVLRVSLEDGSSSVVTPPDSAVVFYGIDVLPGARHALVVTAATRGTSAGDTRIGVLDLGTGAIVPLMPGVAARYVQPGRLLVVRVDGSMFISPFDLGSRTASGAATILPDSVGTLRYNGYWQGLVNVADDGTLYYLRSPQSLGSTPVYVDREGKETEIDASYKGALLVPRVSPDGLRLAAELADLSGSQPTVRDLRTGSTRTLRMPGTVRGRVAWMHDSRGLSIVSSGDGPAQLFIWRLDSDVATPMRRYDPRSVFGSEWSRDGRWLVLRTDDQAEGKADILAVRLGVDTVAVPVVASPELSEFAPALSPDARWLAYVSNEGGRYEVRVTDFPGGRDRWQVSTAGGTEPAWSPDGRELYYAADGQMMAATVAPGADFRILNQRRLFSTAPYALYGIWSRNYDVTRDGRFLMLRRDENATSSIVVVQNWAPR
ncbi:MAG: serine/threonine-protein kinase [Gemmatimonadetes bacterium]|nr:serine/threonine-protein kinase [Gemmatimonadota bacterium]